MSLRSRILLLAAANAALFAAALVWFAQTHLQKDFAALLLEGSRNRLTEIALSLARELSQIAICSDTPPSTEHRSSCSGPTERELAAPAFHCHRQSRGKRALTDGATRGHRPRLQCLFN